MLWNGIHKASILAHIKLAVNDAPALRLSVRAVGRVSLSELTGAHSNHRRILVYLWGEVVPTYPKKLLI